jgi:hypothetical protein
MFGLGFPELLIVVLILGVPGVILYAILKTKGSTSRHTSHLPGGAPGKSNLTRKFCHNCGAQIDAQAEICPKCGVRQNI